MVGTFVKQNCLHKQNEGKASFCPGLVGIITDSELAMSHCFLHRFEDSDCLSFTLLDRFHLLGLSAWVMGWCCPRRTKSWAHIHTLGFWIWKDISPKSPASLGPSIWNRPIVKLSGRDTSLFTICLTARFQAHLLTRPFGSNSAFWLKVFLSLPLLLVQLEVTVSRVMIPQQTWRQNCRECQQEAEGPVFHLWK